MSFVACGHMSNIGPRYHFSAPNLSVILCSLMVFQTPRVPCALLLITRQTQSDTPSPHLFHTPFLSKMQPLAPPSHQSSRLGHDAALRQLSAAAPPPHRLSLPPPPFPPAPSRASPRFQLPGRMRRHQVVEVRPSHSVLLPFTAPHISPAACPRCYNGELSQGTQELLPARAVQKPPGLACVAV